ncbi:PaaI family thioesterase [Bradyrhizobium diazoefficiens]|nr:PaaI family thioesterase [Bradyrhizobium diazoefficiens]QQO20604.1 PaaI family thioesterase [Bradyrhizobium diazoefficiens]
MPLSDDQLLARMNQRMSPTGVLLGARLLQLDSQRGVVYMAFDAKIGFCNPMGNVQGGFIAAMLDEAASIAAIAHAQKKIGFPTLDFNVVFLAPARPGILHAEGRVMKFGSRAVFLEADLLDRERRHLARMSATAMPVPLEAPTLVERSPP